ncbi:MAG TPA: 3-hydroxyacyl-CoA dehydrogenase NAD-binding domain-containing protein [Dongiaceae bacterium]|nr:3-hydroxyacyl-CoA dehydrogenase NAD-binding domain-containing protein [Dongiaceae bacterium]
MSGPDGIRKIGVVGAGQMGSGIAQVAASAGYDVLLTDTQEPFLDRALKGIGQSLAKLEEKGEIQKGGKDAALGRITRSLSLDSLAPCDWVVEAVNESIELKHSIFATLDRVCGPAAILVTNTSSISITKIAAVTRRPAQVIGMHFMNPVPLMKLVEIIPGQATAAATTEATRALAIRMGKTPVVAQDLPGFISNRVLMPLLNEAMFALYEGVGTREDIDTVMTLGMRHPMGPLRLADYIGLDTCLWVMQVLHDGFGDPKYRPCPLLRRLVDAGHLGKKSGRGFYDYTAAAGTTAPAAAEAKR